MATWTPQGLVPTTLPQYAERLNGVFRTALGADLDLAPETPQGQIVALFAEMLAEEDEALVAVSNGSSLDRALGSQIDDLGSLLGIGRLAQARSTVGVTLTGTPGTVIREGARARTAANDVFALTAAATIGSNGSVSATMQAVEPGPVAAPAGTLTGIFDLIVGWTGVTNSAAAMLGRYTETDVAYRARYWREMARNARSGTESVLAAVLAVEGVEVAIIRENDTGESVTIQGNTIPPHSICVVVDGGTEGVARAIYRTKTAGTGTAGDTTVDIAVADGWTIPIRFFVVTRIPLVITVRTTLLANFPAGGISLIKTRVADWFAGRWRSGTGDFDTSGVGIGEPLDTNRLLSPIQSVPGHRVSSVTVERETDLVGSGLTGGARSDLTTLQAITDGTLVFNALTLTGLDFSSATDLADVATVLQTLLRSAAAPRFDDAIVAYDETLNAFGLTLGFDGSGAPYQISDYPTGTTATPLGLTETAGASIVQQPRSQAVTDVSGVLLRDRLTVEVTDVDVRIST